MTLASFQNLLERFNYNLPQNLIAQQPAVPRDSARLLVYRKNDNKVLYDTFAHLGRHLPKHSVLVFNQTKVYPARLEVFKETGGKAEILYVNNDKTHIQVISNKKLTVGSYITLFDGRQKVLSFHVVKKADNLYFLKPPFPVFQILEILSRLGKTPLPPYIKDCGLTEFQKRQKYQAVFAKTGVSVAAPTASLHFTKSLLNQLQKQGIDVSFVQLDVNLGTFTPLREEQFQSGRLHCEFYKIDKKTAQFLNQAKAAGRPIIAVGTTVVRTLESATTKGKLNKLSGQTDLFIKEDFRLRFTDGLITNFHVPKSSLLMLVSSLIGHQKLFELYDRAIENKFRFFSFGDGMIILP